MDEKSNVSIVWQNKDIVAKALAEQFKGKSFAVYGIDVPKIAEAKPTNLPAVEANELRLDNLFLLTDGTYMLVDYESKYLARNKCDYLKYLARVVERLYNEIGSFVKIKLVIIYTADVARGSTRPVIDLGCLRLELTEAFLTDFKPEKIREKVLSDILAGQFSEEDMMLLIIYPLTFKGRKEKQKAVGEAIELAKKIKDEDKKFFVLKMIYVFSDKFITDEDARRIMEVISMTKVDALFLERERKAVEKAVAENTEQVTDSVSRRIASNMLQNGLSKNKVSAIVGMPLSEVRKIADSLKAQ